MTTTATKPAVGSEQTPPENITDGSKDALDEAVGSDPLADSNSPVKIWAPIVAVLGAIIVGVLAFTGVRYCKKNAQNNGRTKKVRVPAPADYEAPYADSQYAQPYGDAAQNENAGNMESREVYEEYHSETEYETYEET